MPELPIDPPSRDYEEREAEIEAEEEDAYRRADWAYHEECRAEDLPSYSALRQALTLAAELIARPERIAYGAAPISHAERYGYYIDGEYCGPDLKEALLRAATDTR